MALNERIDVLGRHDFSIGKFLERFKKAARRLMRRVEIIDGRLIGCCFLAA